ncbi:hypothetical protein QFC21_001532 [Naganishia friedmannii]|uniref:Uncharacterized protein n=1 Tax=Naganishia friedmannii TaxID=89922 RepID=A0ACC2W4P0_9TREE|nr:hypothetical protein QFC21_001532 [Naganishia friedmannii]
MIGAVTTFGEGSGESSADEEPSSEMCPNATAQKRRRTTYYFHPKDRQSPFFKLRLRYAPEELLVANSHMPGSKTTIQLCYLSAKDLPLISCNLVEMEDESDPAHPSHTSPTRSPSPAGSGLLLLQPEFDLDSDPLSDVSSSSDYSSSSPHASQTDDDTDTADDSLDDQREAFKRPRSPERNEPGSDEDDKKRIKVLHGVGTKEDDPIEIDDDESDDEAVLARAVAEIHRLNELEELQAEEARIELQRQQVQARIAALRREEEPQHVQDTVKEESVAEAVPAAVAIAEAAVMGNATANADVIPKQEVKEEN